eukprot:GEMP01040523.1.p1 GENE.GEMP01040523.1~~GEMP01040523.1.p1  ORF type:complete len:455 (+),score=126.40 GEMP01040523.1:40-1404(+)
MRWTPDIETPRDVKSVVKTTERQDAQNETDKQPCDGSADILLTDSADGASVAVSVYMKLLRDYHTQEEEIATRDEQVARLREELTEAEEKKNAEESARWALSDAMMQATLGELQSELEELRESLNLANARACKSTADAVKHRKVSKDLNECRVEIADLKSELSRSHRDLHTMEQRCRKMVSLQEHQKCVSDLTKAEDRTVELNNEVTSARQSIKKLKYQLKLQSESSLQKELNEAKAEARQWAQLGPAYEELQKTEMAQKAAVESLEMTTELQQNKQAEELRKLKLELSHLRAQRLSTFSATTFTCPLQPAFYPSSSFAAAQGARTTGVPSVSPDCANMGSSHPSCGVASRASGGRESFASGSHLASRELSLGANFGSGNKRLGCDVLLDAAANNQNATMSSQDAVPKPAGSDITALLHSCQLAKERRRTETEATIKLRDEVRRKMATLQEVIT